MTDTDLEAWRKAAIGGEVFGSTAILSLIDECVRARTNEQRQRAELSTWMSLHKADREAFGEMARQIVRLSEMLGKAAPKATSLFQDIFGDFRK